MSRHTAVFVWGALVSFVVAGVYLMTFLGPDRNRLTQLINKSLRWRVVPPVGMRAARPQMLIVGLFCLAMGLVFLALAFRAPG